MHFVMKLFSGNRSKNCIHACPKQLTRVERSKTRVYRSDDTMDDLHPMQDMRDRCNHVHVAHRKACKNDTLQANNSALSSFLLHWPFIPLHPVKQRSVRVYTNPVCASVLGHFIRAADVNFHLHYQLQHRIGYHASSIGS